LRHCDSLREARECNTYQQARHKHAERTDNARRFPVPDVIWATPLYEFLRQCDLSPLDKTVLDCGAGGDVPPLSLFYRHGYRTCGIDIQEEAVAKAERFCRENRMPLNIFLGDMRNIPFASESFSFVFSFNAIFFMTKADIAIAMREIERVLTPNGLCYVNFTSVDDPDRRPFGDNAYARRLLGSERFAYYEDNEADAYFKNFTVLRKEKRLLEKLVHEKRLRQAYIEYIAKKK
jgi:SAM-dependent methyltransferase